MATGADRMIECSDMMQRQPRGVSIVLGSYNRRRLLKLAIASVRKEVATSLFETEIIVVDGGSTDGSLEWLTKQKDIITIVQYNRGTWLGKAVERRSWGYFMNLGFKCAKGKYICMISDDCLVVPGAITNGYLLFEEELERNEKIGAVAFYWRNWPEQKKYWVGLTFGNKMFVNHGMYLKSALEDVGYIDENTYSFYHADGDLCLRMWQKGYGCVDSPHSYIEHFAHAGGKVSGIPDWEFYANRWEKLLGKPEKDWIEKEHKDQHRTANLFKRRWFL